MAAAAKAAPAARRGRTASGRLAARACTGKAGSRAPGPKAATATTRSEREGGGIGGRPSRAGLPARRRKNEASARGGAEQPSGADRLLPGIRTWKDVEMALSAIAINCSLKGSRGEDSSTDKMIGLLVSELKKQGVEFRETIRIADHVVKPGVTSDEGGGDQWPDIRRRILEADILIFGTPIWLGQMSSIAKCVVERMDAFLSETDEKGRMPSFGKIALLAIVGNEDGGHGVSAQLYQALNDTGWTIPASAVSYWVGEAMQKTDFKDLPAIPDKVSQSAAMAAVNAAHLAALLKREPYPGSGETS
jgi:multimeric flavodoxin WrbA